MKRDYSKSPIKIFTSYISTQKRLFIIDMLCAVLVAAVDLVFPYVSRMSMNTLLPNKLFSAFFAVMAIMVLAYVLKAALYYIITVVGHRMGVLVEAKMREDVFTMIAMTAKNAEKSLFGRRVFMLMRET